MPIVITRLNNSMGTPLTMPAQVIRAVLAGTTIHAPNDPNPQSPVHIDDMTWQLRALHDAAATPAYIVNWSREETMPIHVLAWGGGGDCGQDVDVVGMCCAGGRGGD